MFMMFKGKTVLITGGSRGIGEQLVEDFKLAGAIVTSTDTTNLNFLDPNSIAEFLNSIKDLDIDICINNAGINEINPFCETSDQSWEDIIAVNLTGTFKITKSIIKKMMKREDGKVINVSSIWGHKSKIGRAAYSASKFGLRGLTQAIAAEAASKGVLVNSVSPGFTRTELTERILGPDGIAEIEKSIPLGRLATSKEISNVIMFLASDLNTYISGQDIVIDGGFLNA
jgi:NAD(P)-dependent dehydrogenase (short-subunit alcohol dehydrogenase family)